MLIHTATELASYINTHRKQKKLSQGQTGASVGLKQTTISKFEIKPGSTHIDTLFRLLAALDLEMTINPKKKVNSQNNQAWNEEW